MMSRFLVAVDGLCDFFLAPSIYRQRLKILGIQYWGEKKGTLLEIIIVVFPKWPNVEFFFSSHWSVPVDEWIGDAGVLHIWAPYFVLDNSFSGFGKKKKKVPLPERNNNLTSGTGNEQSNKRTSPMFHFPTAKNTTKVGWLGQLHRRILGSQSPNKEQSTAEDVQTPPYEMLGPNYKCCYSFSFINLGIQLNIAWRKNSIDLLC